MMLVALEHTFPAYQATFSGLFQPLRDPKYWLVAKLKLNIIGDRLKLRMSGPLKTIRIKNQMDRRCPDAPRQCSNYLQRSHIAPNCPYDGYFHK